jgi:hypothetical protein
MRAAPGLAVPAARPIAASVRIDMRVALVISRRLADNGKPRVNLGRRGEL